MDCLGCFSTVLVNDGFLLNAEIRFCFEAITVFWLLHGDRYHGLGKSVKINVSYEYCIRICCFPLHFLSTAAGLSKDFDLFYAKFSWPSHLIRAPWDAMVHGVKLFLVIAYISSIISKHFAAVVE